MSFFQGQKNNRFNKEDAKYIKTCQQDSNKVKQDL